MNLREFFCFNKSDRQVLLVIVVAISLFLTATYLMRDKDVASDEQMAADRTDGGRYGAQGGKAQAYYRVEGRKAELFPFDPNTADSTQLLRLGLQPWQVRNIYRYRAAGGVYREPKDFAQLYGLTVKQYRTLEPYIRISSDYMPASSLFAHSSHRLSKNDYGQEGTTAAPYEARPKPSATRDTLRYPVKLKPGQQIALNSSDTAQLKKVPGIGSYYARQIVRYREKLGGFCSTDQLLEIEGFPEDALPYFHVSPGAIQKLNVNKLSAAQLRKHPYISYFMAKAITDYRRMKGPLHSLQELRLLPDFTPELIQRLQPYVEF